MSATTERRRRAAVAAALALALTVPAHAGDADPERWLARMSEAARALNYDGTFVYRNGDWMESMRIIHRAGPDGSRARLISLSGEAREVLRDDNRVTCILPDSSSVLVSRSKPRALTSFTVFEPSGDYARHYTLAAHGGGRVAGRETRTISVMPRDGLRYGYRLSMDLETGLLLKSELVDRDGAPLEQIVYTTIEMPETVADSLLEPAISGEGFTWYTSDPPQTPAGESGWVVEWLPPGFEMRDRASDPARFGRMPVEHLVYTDGLASVSVFIEHLDASGDGLEGLSTMGAVNAFGAMVDGFQVTAVGEVPGDTVERIGRSVRRR